jgi:hypothetical protein
MDGILRDRDLGPFLASEAIESKLMPFLAPLDIAFMMVARFQDEHRSQWARQVLEGRIAPHFYIAPFAH